MRLWARDFSLYFTARSISALGDALMPVATALAVGGLYGVTGVGVTLAVWTAPFVALVLFGGVLSDRFGARRMMIGAATFAVSALCLLLPGWPGPAAASSCFTSPRLSASWAASCCSPSRRYETSSVANSPSPI
ncbi:MAG TPA: hypothetical protein VFC19_38360 [Candidatus Limnocylindrales bacterium]|nr:hypothetical protein [Candidatus Limnocylindrales bacterium]